MNNWKNERGSVAFYTIGLLGVTAILMFLFVNMIKIYAAENQASTSAEQAAIAATDVVFEKVYEAVTSNSFIALLEAKKISLEDELDTEEELSASVIAKILEEIAAIDDVLDFKDDVEKEKDDLPSELYKNQIAMVALDRVLTEKLEKSNQTWQHTIYSQFRGRVIMGLNESKLVIPDKAKQIVTRNNGEASETVICMFNDENRIEVKTASKYEESSYDGLFTGGTRNIEQEAVGPSINFIDEIAWVNGSI